ncbi:Hypothetical protein SMA_0784 [Streptococcus macedonicus ACA-DC 198]|uniref:Type VII secretion effector n=1 Tax=Streptococcus gallolyticus TaxID=315405 RepID=A0A380K862_9STRE|nr:TIGR04197 family type VII secretion effector [Streptococcus macedonicus]WGK80041.1 TIGR04197 family type VII secretion effector [Streptococcus macedonicus]CCF02075.1 Hypothetical protein SMA_0784 [Streptococcus macedonicus ACA-DC 198]SUN60447.1 type VII secretion effector [Streptococcus gallolyticus]
MTTIRSDKETAQTYASQLVTACQTLSDVGNASQDTQTELQGNTKAHDLMEESKSLLAQIVSSVETASQNLHSVASDFEVVDQLGAESFGS